MALGGSIGLGIVLTASDLASGTLRKVAREFAQLDVGVGKVAATLGGLGPIGVAAGASLQVLSLGAAAAGAALSAAFGLAQTASELQYRIAEIATTTGLASGEVEDFKKQLMGLGSAGEVGPEEAAKIFRQLADSSLSSKQALDALAPTVDILAASFGRLSPEQAGGLMVKTLQAFPELADDATGAADRLARAFKAGLKPEEIDHAMRLAAKGATYLGGSMEEVLTTIAGVKAAGFPINHLSAQMVQLASRSMGFEKGTRKMIAGLNDFSVTAEKLARNERATWKGTIDAIENSFRTLVDSIGLKLEDFFGPALDKVRLAVSSIAELFTTGEISGALADDLLKAENQGIFNFVQAVSHAVAQMRIFWEEHGDQIVAVLSTVASTAVDTASFLIEEVGGAIKELRQFWDLYGEDIGRAMKTAIEVVGPQAKMVKDVFVGTFEAVKGAVVAISGFLTGQFELVYKGLADFANGGIDLLNALIERAASVPVVGKALQGVKLEHFRPSEVATLFGDTEEALAAKKREQGDGTAPTRPAGSASPAASGGAPGLSGSSPTTSTGALPATAGSTTLTDSRPPAAANAPSSGPSDAAMAQLAEAITKAIGKQPVVVNGHLEIDGMKLADWQARTRRDRSAAAGVTRRPFHSFESDE
jgi:hypothetical protein